MICSLVSLFLANACSAPKIVPRWSATLAVRSSNPHTTIGRTSILIPFASRHDPGFTLVDFPHGCATLIYCCLALPPTFIIKTTCFSSQPSPQSIYSVAGHRLHPEPPLCHSALPCTAWKPRMAGATKARRLGDTRSSVDLPRLLSCPKAGLAWLAEFAIGLYWCRMPSTSGATLCRI